MNALFRVLRARTAPRIMRVPLSQGLCATIDASDWPQIAGLKWYAHRAHRTHYAVTNVAANSKRTVLSMHRLIAGVPDGLDVDHRNGNGLDNRRVNLRLATDSQNHGNNRLSRNSLSGVKGVYREQKYAKWHAQIMVGGRKVNLGRHTHLIEAAHAYDNEARRYFGPYAAVNFPQPGERGCK